VRVGLLVGVVVTAVVIMRGLSETGREPPVATDTGQRVVETAQPIPDDAALASLQSLELAWLHPLFNPDRKPDPKRGGEPSGHGLEGMQLTGVVIDGARRMAMFKQVGGPNLTLKEGAMLNAGWQVVRIDARRVELHSADNSRVLQLATPRLPAVPVPSPTRDGRP
jgi:hypothetical protein